MQAEEEKNTLLRKARPLSSSISVDWGSAERLNKNAPVLQIKCYLTDVYEILALAGYKVLAIGLFKKLSSP